MPSCQRRRQAVLEAWRWSSHLAYLSRAPAPAWLSTDLLAFFGRTREQARRACKHLINEAFGKRAESPWEALQGGLALGSPAFQKRVSALLREKGGEEELRWVAHAEDGTRRIAAAAGLAARQPEQPWQVWQVWVRMHLGGERRIDIARACGYKDGSTITQILKRVQSRARSKPAPLRRISRLQAELDHILSSFDSAEKARLSGASKYRGQPDAIWSDSNIPFYNINPLAVLF